MSDLPPVISLLLIVVVPVVLIRAHAAVSDPVLAGWARAHGLELTADNRPLFARYLRRARLLRSWGVVAGLLLPTIVELAVSGRFEVLGFARDQSAPLQGPMTIFIGYLAGALCAELSMARRVESAERSASLIPRTLEDYLPRRLMYAQRALGLAVIVGVFALGVVPHEHQVAAPTWLALLTGAGLCAGFVVALEALERWVVRRPQPYTTSTRLAADDAIRAQSVHALAGSGLALLLMALCGVATALAASGVPVLRWTMWPLAAIAFVLSIRACQDVAHRPWRVRRSISHVTGPAPT